MAVRVWVYSPHATANEALARHVEALGFVVQEHGDGAAVAVFDLVAYGAQLPPAPPVPCLAMVAAADRDILGAVRRLGYREMQRPHDPPGDVARKLYAIVLGASPDPELFTDLETPPQLTARETQVLGLLMLGLTNKRIAQRLEIAERTVKHHMSSLIRKHGVEGRLGLLMRFNRVQQPSAAAMEIEPRAGSIGTRVQQDHS
jgi:DNA-binding NarL/FixJ family response regulator